MLQFSDNKAGMDGLDKEKICRVIEENTSANYSQYSKKQQERIAQRTSDIKRVLSRTTPSELQNAEQIMNSEVARLESTRDLTRHCVHIDMDAYFAAVEMRDAPRLRTVPMAVGTSAMLGTSNYLARRFGVRAAMPGFIAKKLCPELEIVPGNYDKYGKESKIFSAIFAEYDVDFSMGSLDEAYLDITDHVASRNNEVSLERRRYGGKCICFLPQMGKDELGSEVRSSSETCPKCTQERIVYSDVVTFGTTRAEVVREIRFRVEQKTGLTCSAGIGPNFMLAKICSDLNKPNGQYELANDYTAVMDFLKDLPIRKVSGIGRVAEAQLQACGVGTVGELLNRRATLRFVFSPLAQETFLRYGLGLSSRPSSFGDSKQIRKSISVERTFSTTSDVNDLKSLLREVCDELAQDIDKRHIAGGRCVTLKLKLSSFDVLTRSLTPGVVVKTVEDMQKYAGELLSREIGQSIRLLGVRLSNLVHLDKSTNKRKTVLDHLMQNPKKRKDSELADHFECSAVAKLGNYEEPAEVEPSFSAPSGVDRTDETGEIIEASEDTVMCPVCDERLKNEDRAVNEHIDLCLNRELVADDAVEVVHDGVMSRPKVFSTKDHDSSSATSMRAEKGTRKSNLHAYFNKAEFSK